jgi:hypothetical protein
MRKTVMLLSLVGIHSVGCDLGFFDPADPPGQGNGEITGGDAGSPQGGGGWVIQIPVDDGGWTSDDAGSSDWDAGPAPSDGGPAQLDGGEVDGGPVEVDAGIPVLDGGPVEVDAGSSLADAGSPAVDAGSPVLDGGAPTGSITFALGAAKMSGDGCPQGSGTLTAAAGGFKLSLTALKVHLARNDPTGGSRASCVVRIPVNVPPGFFLSLVVQHFGYSVEKSLGATAAFTGSFALFGERLPQVEVKANRRAASSTLNAIASGTGSMNGMCSPSRQADGLLALNYALNVTKDAVAEEVKAEIHGAEYAHGVQLVLSACP